MTDMEVGESKPSEAIRKPEQLPWAYLLPAIAVVLLTWISGELEWLVVLPLLFLLWRLDRLYGRLQRLEIEFEAWKGLVARQPEAESDLAFDAGEIRAESEPAAPKPPTAAAAARAAQWNGPEASAAGPAAPSSAARAVVDREAGRPRPPLRGQEYTLRETAGEGAGSSLSGALRAFFMDGNLVARIGILVLFFGVAFLLKYAAENALLPLELRLAGAAAAGLVIIVLGWRLRERRGIYALLLQGCGVGVLYLTTFAAARLYELLPLGLAFFLMLGLVAVSVALAVLQDSRHFAAFAAAGGFLAPLLTASEQGSHILLFSYYALLNAGLVGLAWYRAWRELNLLGFAFTFVIGGAWGYYSYRPELFATTLGFLVLFAVLYVAIAVLFAHRAPLRLRGYVDGTLVFGVPLVGFSLLSAMLPSDPMALALAALLAGGFYLLLARLLWRQRVEGMRQLTESFLAIGVVFLTLAVPLALDGRWTSALWALEGSALVWLGVAQRRGSARWFGLALQMGAAAAFLLEFRGQVTAQAFLNDDFLGTSLIALAGGFSAWQLWWRRDRLYLPEQFLASLALVWALAWWLAGGWLQIQRLELPPSAANAALLLFHLLSAVLLLALREALRWRQLDPVLAAWFYLLALHLLAQVALGQAALQGAGWLVWPLGLSLTYVMLWRQREQWQPAFARPLHATAFWTWLVFASHEFYQVVVGLEMLGDGWSLAAVAIPGLGVLAVLALRGARLAWPVSAFRDWYLGPVLRPLIGLLMAWVLLVSTSSAAPAPLRYLPLINPVELVALGILLLLAAVYRGVTDGVVDPGPRRTLGTGLALSAFCALTAVVARCVHHFAGVSYSARALFESPVFQTAISVVWTLLALAVTVTASRGGRRLQWFLGAGLLLVVVVKLFTVDLGGSGTIARILSFILVGGLMLAIGYLAPAPPRDGGRA